MDKWIWPLTCIIDFAWQRRSCGVAYNSLSGHSFLIGARSKKILDVVVFSKTCRKCKKTSASQAKMDGVSGEIPPSTQHRCPCNFKGSSKSMEPIAAVKMIVRLFDTVRAFVSVLIGDDDSTVRAQARHSYQERLNTGAMTDKEKEWPKNKSGNFVADHGKLPLRVKEIDKMLADPSHRCKSWGRALYKLYYEKGRQIGMTKIDCERLKRNFSYWHRQNVIKPFEIFQKAFRAVIEHHFGNHSYCEAVEDGGWCLYKNNQEAQRQGEEDHRFRNPKTQQSLYEALTAIWEKFATTEMLIQLFHPFSSQKSESLNQQVTCVAPKDMHFSSTMSLHDRVCFVAIIDSVGYYLGLLRLCKALGVALPHETKLYLERRDQRRAYQKEYQQRPSSKRRRVAKRNETIREGLKQQKEDGSKGLGYAPSIAVAEQIGETTEQTNQTTEKKVRRQTAKKTNQTSTRRVRRRCTFCKWCESTSHLSKGSRKCPENPYNKRKSSVEGALSRD